MQRHIEKRITVAYSQGCRSTSWTSLLHLQEVGSLQAVHPHISQREDLVSFLCFIVLSGEGELSYEEQLISWAKETVCSSTAEKRTVIRHLTMSVVKKLLASGMSADEILEKLK